MKYILIILMMFTILCTCFGAEKPVKKTVSQSTAKENQIRRQMFEACVQQTGSRSNCYRLYYN